LGLKNISSVISSQSLKATGRNDSSNVFRHAIHTLGQKEIGTEEIAESCQHSAFVAKKHYVHKVGTDSAFPKFYQMIREKNEKIEEDRSSENSYLKARILQEPIKKLNADFEINKWVAVVYQKWYIGKVIEANPIVVDFMEEYLLEK